MAGNFALNTGAHPTTNFVVVHGRTGVEYKLTGTPVAIVDPSDRATVRSVMNAAGTKYIVES